MNRILKVAISLSGLIALLSGCQSVLKKEVWKEYNVPPPEVSWSQDTIKNEPILSPRTKLTIDKACEIALTHNPQVATSKGNLGVASAQIGLALANLLPQLPISAAYSVSSPTGVASVRASRFIQIAGNAEDSALSLANIASYSAAEYNALSAAENLETTSATILLQVRQAYLYYISAMAQLKVADDNVNDTNEHLRDARVLYEIGSNTMADVAQAQANYSNAQLRQITARNSVDVSRVQLNQILGLEEDPNYDVDLEIPHTFLDITLGEAVYQARRSRPELKASKESYMAAEESLRQAWAGYLPSISLTGSDTWANPAFPLISAFPLARTWAYGPTVSWNALTLQVPYQVKQAQASLLSARASIAQTEQQVYADVQQAWLGVQSADESIRVASQTVTSAQESLNLTTGQYRVGRASSLQVVDAELTLSQAKANEVNARYNYEISVAKLLYSMGLAKFEKKGKK